MGCDTISFAIMKSAFGSKRKARKIQVDEEEDGAAKDIAGANQSASSRKFYHPLSMTQADD